jgi:hypothetical protein
MWCDGHPVILTGLEEFPKGGGEKVGKRLRKNASKTLHP